MPHFDEKSFNCEKEINVSNHRWEVENAYFMALGEAGNEAFW